MRSNENSSSGKSEEHVGPVSETGTGRHPPWWRKHRRALAKGGVAAGIIAVGALRIAPLVSSSGNPASAGVKPVWMMTAGNIQQMSQQDGPTTSYFFHTAAAKGAGSSLVKTPIQAGYATTPVLAYTSYARFSSDIKANSITYPYKWVMYDPENWSQTPVSEQQNPIGAMRQFGKLAHAHGLQVVMAPSLDLGAVAGSVLPRQKGESVSHWYVRVNIAGAAAAAGNTYIFQDEFNTTNVPVYASLFNSVKAQAHAANATGKVYSEVSTMNGTAAQMAAAVKSVTADGFYVATPGATNQGVQFFKQMKAAGY